MKWCRLGVLVVSASVLAGCGVVTDPEDVAPEVYVETPEPSPHADAVFGRERVDDAYAELTEFVLAEAFPPELLDPERTEYSPADLAGEDVTGHLTGDAAEEWKTLVDAALAGDDEAHTAVQAMRYYDVDRPWTVGEDPVVASQQITGVTIEVDPTDGPGRELLLISFEHDASLEYDDEGTPVGFDVEKEMTYLLVPAPGGGEPSWLIADFDGDFDVVDWP